MQRDLSTFESIATPALRSTGSERAKAPAATKLRSCITCRTRRVRCDKRSPCSNCRRANIACVVPSTEGPPRWARNLEKRPGIASQPVAPNIARIKERLKNLEGLVKQFSNEIEEANTATESFTNESSTTVSSIDPSASTSGFAATGNPETVPSQSGRFCDLNTHYVTSGFWNKMDEELAGLRAATQDFADLDSENLDEELARETESQNLSHLSSGPESFPFSIKSNASLDEYRPLPSQIPYLLEMYECNVNFFVRVIHMPTLLKTTRSPHFMLNLSPVDESLLFAVYYAAIASMEDSDVLSSFGYSRAFLTTKYRLGLEMCLTRADFLNNPNFTIVQALVLFLGLHRRHESPRFVWIMFGLVTRMAQYLGLHRDGSHSPQLSIFEVEMRRRVWWTMCLLDQKVSEDQGTHMAYASLDFDTKQPLNINDSDINPQTVVVPPERFGVTDMSFARISVALTEVHRQLLSSNPSANLDEKGQIIAKIYQNFQSQYLQYTTDTDGGISYWMSVCMARLVMAKLVLLSFFPIACSSTASTTSQSVPDSSINTKLLHAAIHVAEFNHAMNAEEQCRHWRWIYQTCTHWHSSVYLALAIPKLEWSPIAERAWVALTSPWLVPSKAFNDQRIEIWFPIKKLLKNARGHRDAELKRLRENPIAARALETKEAETPFESHPAPFSTEELESVFLQRWRRVVGLENEGQTVTNAVLDDPLALLTYSGQNHSHSEAQAGGSQGAGGSSEHFDAGTEGLIADLDSLDSLDSLDGMELDTGEDWQAWIESALNAEHTDLLEEH